MLLTITNTAAPATDLGYLLHKSPDRLHTFDLSFGKAHVFYPEASNERCTVALCVEVDSVALVRDRQGPAGEGGLLDQYVNDRAYASSSFLSVAIGRVFGTALSGRSKHRPELAADELPLCAGLHALSCRSGAELINLLFAPLGYQVECDPLPLSVKFPEWGGSPYFNVKLSGKVRLSEMLAHLYVLVPVLDDEKHYWVGQDEIEKLLRRGTGWLATHPQRELIARRYLKHRQHLTREALARLVDESADPDADSENNAEQEAKVEEQVNLHEQRLGTVVAILRQSGAQRVLDLGCGEGRLLAALLQIPQFTKIAGVDVSHRALERAVARLRLERLAPKQRERIELFQGSLIYSDKRFGGFDAAALVEVIEHLDRPRLDALTRIVWGIARPRTIVVTTPNVEYNALFPSLPAGRLRHRDHRFEWTRQEFKAWAEQSAMRFGYRVRFLPVGPVDAELGPPTQLAIFERHEAVAP